MEEKILIDGLYHDVEDSLVYDTSSTATITFIATKLIKAGQAVYANDVLKYIPVPFKPKKCIGIDWMDIRNIKAGIIREVR